MGRRSLSDSFLPHRILAHLQRAKQVIINIREGKMKCNSLEGKIEEKKASKIKDFLLLRGMN